MSSENVRRLDFQSWREFRSTFLDCTFGSRPIGLGEYAFRGQRDAAWNLTPTFDRIVSNPDTDRASAAVQIIDEFRNMCSLNSELEALCRPDSTGRLTALAQHWGVPTRLLDWTDNPLVAAFFAFAGFLEAEPERDGCVAVWALDLKHRAWQGMGVDIVRLSAASNPRMHSQRGLFTLSVTPFASLEEFVVHAPGKDALLQATIPAAEYAVALAELEVLDISWSSLFPGLEGDARQARANAFRTLKRSVASLTR